MIKELKNKPTSINEIVYKKTKEHIPFEELDSSIKFEILTYIKRYKLGFKAFGTKGFDIIRNIFFAHEYVLDDDYFCGLHNQTVEFTSFEEFISYVGEEIYNSSCYYGYSFTSEQITKFRLETSKLNFDSFINYDINQFSFDNLTKEKNEENKEKVNLCKKMEKWWIGLNDIKSCDDLSKAYRSFIGRFESHDSKNIFFSLIHLKYGTRIAKFVSEFLCRNDVYCGIEFIDILIRYGYEWGQYVIDHFNCMCSYATVRRRIQRFKATFNDYNSGAYHSERRCGFEETKQLYYIDYIMVNDDRRGYHTRQYLFSFNDLAERMNGDLSWSDFSKAPIEREEIIKYKTSENTKFPIEKTYSSYSIEKYYKNGEFRVEQRWFDNSNNLLLEKENCFDFFFDFVHFLKKDLSDADLLFCDGIENIKIIKDLNLSNIHLRSEIASRIGIIQDNLPTDKYEVVTFEEPSNLELATIGELETQHHGE